MDTSLWVSTLPAPDGWIWAKSYEEATEILNLGGISFMSVRYHLGYETAPPGHLCSTDKTCSIGCRCRCHRMLATGYDLIKWIASQEWRWPAVGIHVHGDNTLAQWGMYRYIDRHGPYNKQLTADPEPATVEAT